MNGILLNYPNDDHPFSISIDSRDETTEGNVPHRVLLGNEHNTIFSEYMVSALQRHHISPEQLARRKKLIEQLKIHNCPSFPPVYPSNKATQKGNFAEIFLAEYLSASTSATLPVYRLRYNPNPDQSMKGDDVLMFDLNSDPIRVIVGEAKFRTTPDKKTVVEMVDGLVRSNKGGLPVSLLFVSDQLYQEGKNELGKRILDCAMLFAKDQLQIDYVGLLMSNKNGKNHVNRNVSGELHNLVAISLGMDHPDDIVYQAFNQVRELK